MEDIMKRRYVIIGFFLVLLLATIACGSSGVVVSTPVDNQPGVQPNPASSPTPTQGIVEPLSTATVPLGTSRNNPAPVGSAILVDNMEFIVTGVVRPADSIVSKGNTFNEKPSAGKEYIFITISVNCKSPSDQQCKLSTYNLKVLGSDGILIDGSMFLAGVEGLLEDTTFYGGANVTGNLAFIVNQVDTGLLLVYQPFFGDSFYLSLPK
jgi:hypothetical protein